MEENELVLPEGDDIRNLSGEDLDAYENGARSEIDALFEGDSVTPDAVERSEFLAAEIERATAERNRRTAEQVELSGRRDAVLEKVRGETAAAAETVAATAETEVVEAKSRGGVRTALRALGGVDGPKRNLNAGLRGAKSAPTNGDLGVDLTRAQTFARVTDAEQRRQSVLVASADIPGFTQGGRIATMDQLVTAMHKRARALPVTHNGVGQRVPVATLQREFTHVAHDRMSLEDMSALLELAANPALLTAAGGWCAPHEISYDFYNIVCIDGLVDLPTVGINRGGLSWPVSPSFGDISALPGVVWTWTNTMDTAAATGTAQSGVKPCVRVPCPEYDDATLDCDGMCVTVGNLTQDAFPELIANHIRLVEAIHAHYMNTRLIQALVSTANSTAVGPVGGTDMPVAKTALGSAALQRRDYIEKYAMCGDAVIENIYPRWALDVMREDLKWITGVSDTYCVNNSMIADWLDCRNISAQFVADWQVRATGFPGSATPSTAWPTTLQFLTYPAGTFVRGQGMTLDLGVVRDSVLNETNDYTAAWMEECWLLAKIGHESRLVTVDVGINGRTGAADVTGTQV